MCRRWITPQFLVAGWQVEGRSKRRGEKIRLTSMSDYPTLNVMKSDIASGAPAPPLPHSTATSVRAPDHSMGLDELQSHLVGLLATFRPAQPLTELAADGSPKIASLVSVWLIHMIEQETGASKLVKLSNVSKPADLRSLDGVTGLLHDALQDRVRSVVAS